MAAEPQKPQKLFVKHIVRKIFLEDWAMKLTALVITLGLWFGVTGLSTPTVKRFTIPLNFSISNNAEITTSQHEVEIVVSGDKRRVDQINKAELAATIDLTDVPPGDRVISLEPESVSVPLPQGVKLVEVLPIRFLAKLEAVEEKEIEVQAQTDGNPAEGFEIYSTTVIPPKVRVRGPESFISKLNFVETDKINLSDKKQDFTARQIPVSVANPKAAVLNTVVDVNFKIGEKRAERAFSIPVAASPGKTARFTLYGPRTLLAKIRPETFKIDISDTDNPQLVVPPDLQGLVEVKRLTVK